MMHVYHIFILVMLVSGCDQQTLDYFPLGNKLRWEYSIQQTVNGKNEELKAIFINLPKKRVNNIFIYPRKSASGEIYYFRKTPQAIFYTNNPDETGGIVMNYPLEQGIRWQADSSIHLLASRHESFSGDEAYISLDEAITLDYTVHNTSETVDVPAGRFTECVRIEASGKIAVNVRTFGIDTIVIEQIEWYAPGVGLVKRARKEFSLPEKLSGELNQELISIKKG
jgi:hypothetical protein